MAKKILIIEDYPATSEMMSSILEAEGFKSLVAMEGASGLEMARSQKPDLILLDVMMPGMSGFQVCEKLKADEKTRGIPVIIVSVRGTEENIKKGEKLGADGYVPKPFDPFDLVARIKKLLEGKD